MSKTSILNSRKPKKGNENNERHADGKAFSTVTCLVKVRLWLMENAGN